MSDVKDFLNKKTCFYIYEKQSENNLAHLFLCFILEARNFSNYGISNA